MTIPNLLHSHARSIPDPADRSPNSPAVLVEWTYVRQYVMKQCVLNSEYEALTPSDIIVRYIEMAEKAGWHAFIHGRSVLLTIEPRTVSG